MGEQKIKNLKLGERGAMVSIIAYIILSILKYSVGEMTNSSALKADGLNNATDIIASVAVLIGLRLSQIPADKDHTYGHWKSETIASMVASFIMMMVGLQVLIGATLSIFRAEAITPDITAAYFGLFSAVTMFFVYQYNKKLAQKINSKSVMAAAKDNLSDAWVSIGAVVGILGAQLHMPWLDTLAALLVGVLICKTAFGIFIQASHELSDGFDEEKLDSYHRIIENVHGVDQIRAIKGRNYGNNEVVDVVVLVNPALNIKEAHEIATGIENVLIKENGVFDVHVHVEPNLLLP